MQYTALRLPAEDVPDEELEAEGEAEDFLAAADLRGRLLASGASETAEF